MTGIVLQRYSIAYCPIPKVACTSIKESLYALEHGETYDAEKLGMHVHRYYGRRLEKIEDAEFRFVVLRDPIKRFLSGYSNRVTHHRELTDAILLRRNPRLRRRFERLGIPLDPGFGQFIEFFSEYYRVPTIRHHLQPVTEIFQRGLMPFNRIYTIEELERLRQDLSEWAGEQITFPHSQRGGRKFSVRDLNAGQLEELIDFYREDYYLMKDYYSIDQIWLEWKRS